MLGLSLAPRPLSLFFPLPSPPLDPGGDALLTLRLRPLLASLPPSLSLTGPLSGPFPFLTRYPLRLLILPKSLAGSIRICERPAAWIVADIFCLSPDPLSAVSGFRSAYLSLRIQMPAYLFLPVLLNCLFSFWCKCGDHIQVFCPKQTKRTK